MSRGKAMSRGEEYNILSRDVEYTLNISMSFLIEWWVSITISLPFFIFMRIGVVAYTTKSSLLDWQLIG